MYFVKYTGPMCMLEGYACSQNTHNVFFFLPVFQQNIFLLAMKASETVAGKRHIKDHINIAITLSGSFLAADKDDDALFSFNKTVSSVTVNLDE